MTRRALHWLVDGNNLMHLLPEIMWSAAPAAQPAALAALLKPYRDANSLKLTLFFDGGAELRQTRLSGIAVVFAGPEKSADQVILERLRQSAGQTLGLITNDQALAAQARQSGARLLEASALARKLKLSQGLENDETVGWDFTTRKKGPARRLPKALRRQANLLDKL